MKRVGLLVLLVWLVGCAQSVKVDHAPRPLDQAKMNTERVLILPVKEYRVENPTEWFALSLHFYEAVSDCFLARGFLSVPYEDVLSALKKEGLLVVREKKVKISPTLLEVAKDESWTPAMREEVNRVIEQEVARQGGGGPEIHFSFDEEDIIFLGQKMGAKYVVRGRITESYLREEDTFNPFKIGFLTAPNRILSRFLYGEGDDGFWGWAQEASVGGSIGAIIGSNAQDPFEPPRTKTVRVGHPLFGQTYTKHTGGNEDYDVNNALFWGGMGALVSILAAHGGHAPEAVLNLTLYIYDVDQQALVWENRVRLRVSPQSVWAERHAEDLILGAIEQAVGELTRNFWAYLGLEPLPEEAPENPQEPKSQKTALTLGHK